MWVVGPGTLDMIDLAPGTESQGTKSGTKLGTKSALGRHQVEILSKVSTGAALIELIAIAGRTKSGPSSGTKSSSLCWTKAGSK